MLPSDRPLHVLIDYFLGLGSNLGEREAQLAHALERLGQLGVVLARSALITTAPMYVLDQPDFLNMVALFRTDLRPLDLLHATQAIEQAAGRDRSPAAQRFGPRPLDIDLLLAYQPAGSYAPAQALFIQQPELVIPHPFMAERAFVLGPLRELAPDLVLPGLGVTVAELARRAP